MSARGNPKHCDWQTLIAGTHGNVKQVMKKNLHNPADLTEIMTRLASVRPDSTRQWGKMTPHQMLCHLGDSYLIAMGEREAKRRDNFLFRTVLKWVVLDTPLPWAKGFKTGPTADQEIGGTKPVEFERDRQRLAEIIQRFTAAPRDFQFAPHPVFGVMNEAHWLRWGYLHADHHFRQFGV